MDRTHLDDSLLAQAYSDLDRWSLGDTEGYGASASADVSYFHNAPAGPRVDGVNAFRGFLSGLRGMIPPHEYKVVEPRVQVYGNVGIFTLEYHAFTPDGIPIAQGRGTLVYREEDGRWEMVHTHWSALDDSGAVTV